MKKVKSWLSDGQMHQILIFFCYSPLQAIDIVFIDNEIFIYNSNRLYSKLGMNNQRVPKIAPIQLISFDGDKSKRRLK